MSTTSVAGGAEAPDRDMRPVYAGVILVEVLVAVPAVFRDMKRDLAGSPFDSRAGGALAQGRKDPASTCTSTGGVSGRVLSTDC
jgi:hypothetical protein